MTKKIRIAVACDSHGNCNAAHYSGPNMRGFDSDWSDTAIEGLDPIGPFGLVWVEAEIPLPAEQTVQGTAVLEPAAQSAAEVQP